MFCSKTEGTAKEEMMDVGKTIRFERMISGQGTFSVRANKRYSEAKYLPVQGALFTIPRGVIRFSFIRQWRSHGKV